MMKAIQVKYIGCTNTKPARLKVWAEGQKPVIESYNHAGGCEAQAKEMCERFVIERNWGVIVGFGTLPNGDWVAVL